MGRFVRVYDARRDRRRAVWSQRTTLETDGGLDVLNGILCYSPEWFQAIDAGTIESHQIEGVISRVYMSGHNDFPEFELTAGDQTSTWERYGTETFMRQLLFDRFYKVGNPIRISYVRHPWKTPTQKWEKMLGSHRDVVLYVDIQRAGLVT